MSTGFVGVVTSQFTRPDKPPPFFGIDIDGTFYTENEEAWKRNVEAFAEVKKKGHTPFFCTGRSLKSAFGLLGENFSDKTGYNGYPGVYQNGAIVYDEHGNIIFSSSFSREFLKTLAEFQVANGLEDKCVYYTETDSYSLSPIDERLLEFTSYRKLAIPKVISMEDLLTKKVVITKYSDFKFDIPGLNKGVDYVERVDVKGTCDLSPPDVSKAIGIMKLMEHNGVKPEDCAFIGDGMNDVEAMELCKVSFAVGNASDEVKGHAKRVLDKTCDEGAVAEALEITYGPSSATTP